MGRFARVDADQPDVGAGAAGGVEPAVGVGVSGGGDAVLEHQYVDVAEDLGGLQIPLEGP